MWTLGRKWNTLTCAVTTVSPAPKAVVSIFCGEMGWRTKIIFISNPKTVKRIMHVNKRARILLPLDFFYLTEVNAPVRHHQPAEENHFCPCQTKSFLGDWCQASSWGCIPIPWLSSTVNNVPRQKLKKVSIWNQISALPMRTGVWVTSTHVKSLTWLPMPITAALGERDRCIPGTGSPANPTTVPASSSGRHSVSG